MQGFGQQGQGKQLQQMADRLKLTDAQKEQIRPILQDEAGKLQEIRAKYQNKTTKVARKDRAKELRTVRADAQQRIDAVLTAEQRADWQKFQEERRQNRSQTRKKRK
jgi:Spy/CpxP family protein refolding chaperone